MKTIGYGALRCDAPLEPITFERRALRPNDVAMEILYCGICHSDLHMARNDWGATIYPNVPGHEIVGRVTAIGADVTCHKTGDFVAVGCVADSCQVCDQCRNSEEQFCREGRTDTYNSPDRVTGEITKGGYSKHMVAREEFVMRIAPGLDISRVGPLLCAGITTYAPLRRWKIGAGSRVGVVGLGGLGHMAVKLAAAMGAFVTVISRSPGKELDALELGAQQVLISTDDAALDKAANTFDLIIDTVPVKHDINAYMPLLDVAGTLVIVGQVGFVNEPSTLPLIYGRRQVAGSLIGGLHETQEMLDFCAEKNVLPDCEMVRMDQINAAFERMERSDVRYRFVVDMASLALPG